MKRRQMFHKVFPKDFFPIAFRKVLRKSSSSHMWTPNVVQMIFL